MFAGYAAMAYPPKRVVYIIRSVNHPHKRYIGVTSDLVARLNAHKSRVREQPLRGPDGVNA
jgi:predicted GIY-YIG superfamily endonuclease